MKNWGPGRFENLLSFLKMAGTSLTGNKQPAPVPLDENVVENGCVNIAVIIIRFSTV